MPVGAVIGEFDLVLTGLKIATVETGADGGVGYTLSIHLHAPPPVEGGLEV